MGVQLLGMKRGDILGHQALGIGGRAAASIGLEWACSWGQLAAAGCRVSGAGAWVGVQLPSMKKGDI